MYHGHSIFYNNNAVHWCLVLSYISSAYALKNVVNSCSPVIKCSCLTAGSFKNLRTRNCEGTCLQGYQQYLIFIRCLLYMNTDQV